MCRSGRGEMGDIYRCLLVLMVKMIMWRGFRRSSMVFGFGFAVK